MLIPATHKTMEQAAVVTYTGAASSVLFYGFHISEIAVILSATASVIGVGMQIYVALAKVRLMKRSQRWSMEHRHDKDKFKD